MKVMCTRDDQGIRWLIETFLGAWSRYLARVIYGVHLFQFGSRSTDACRWDYEDKYQSSIRNEGHQVDRIDGKLKVAGPFPSSYRDGSEVSAIKLPKLVKLNQKNERRPNDDCTNLQEMRASRVKQR